MGPRAEKNKNNYGFRPAPEPPQTLVQRIEKKRKAAAKPAPAKAAKTTQATIGDSTVVLPHCFPRGPTLGSPCSSPHLVDRPLKPVGDRGASLESLELDRARTFWQRMVWGGVGNGSCASWPLRGQLIVSVGKD